MVWLWWCLTLAAPTPYVETRELLLEINHADPTVAVLQATLAEALQEAGIKKLLRRSDDGSFEPVRPGKLSAEEIMGCLIAISHNKLGAEADLFVQVKGPAVPVTIWWDEKREMRLASGPAPKNLFPGGPSVKALRSTYGSGPLTEIDRPWVSEARGLLARALDTLSPDERSFLTELPYVRRAEPTAFTLARIPNPSGGQLQATYTSDAKGSRIEVYDAAFLPSGRFSGEPADPQPASLAVLLHELGHAIAWSSTRALVQQSADIVEAHRLKGVAFDTLSTQREAKIADYQQSQSDATLAEIRAMEAELDTLQSEGDTLAQQTNAIANRVQARRGSPAADAFLKVVPMADSPTWYGKTSAEENFAECFALYHLDPAALKRASPAAFAWFNNGKHLEITRADLQGTGI